MKSDLSLVVRGLVLSAVVLSLSNCASKSTAVFSAPPPAVGEGAVLSMQPPASAASGGLRSGADTSSRSAIDTMVGEAVPLTKRPGLATQAGGERYAIVADVPFYRKAGGQPDVVDSFHYNDETGAKAMAEALGGARRRGGSFPAAGGRLGVDLRSYQFASPFERYEAGGRRIVVGNSGRPYQIFLTNRTKHAVEVVASVDGLDVMDGRTASVRNRGYVLPAKSSLAIEGFRVNASTVKQFIFGSVDDSAAAKAGQARNVGVIGLALYDEDEAQAKIARLVESRKRSAATPFAVTNP